MDGEGVVDRPPAAAASTAETVAAAAVKRANSSGKDGEDEGAPGAKRTKWTTDDDDGGHELPIAEQGDAPGAAGILEHVAGVSAVLDHDGEASAASDSTNPYVTDGSPARWRPKRTFLRASNTRRPAVDAKAGDKTYPHGNYRAYYNKRFPYLASGARDPRLCALPEGYFKHKRVLDIGCNSGYITIEIAAKLGAKRAVGVDIDGQLIKEARGNVLDRWSLTKPAPDGLQHQGQWADADVPFDYMPSCMPAIFGRRKILAGRRRFPANVEFVAGDWLQDATERDRPGSYDVVLALSVTKWIHLNNGDAGIRKFFNKVHAVLSPGGKFVLEAQPYNKYKNAKLLNPVISENYKRIRMTAPDAFERYLLEDVGFEHVESLDTPEDQGSGFRRPLLIFTKGQTRTANEQAQLKDLIATD